MSFTLVVTSYGRDADLNRLFGSIARQTFRGRINIAFVNQGFMTPPSRAALPTSIGFAETRTDGRVSVSRARNIGLRDQSAAIIAFPDDDCWYETNLLDNVANYFRDNPTIDCICTNVYDPVRQSVYGKRPMGVIRRVSFANLFRLGISVGIFVRREALELAGGYFDERLGAGTPIGSGEETEFLGRLLSRGCHIEYVGDLQVYHPVPHYSNADVRKNYRYGVDFGT